MFLMMMMMTNISQNAGHAPTPAAALSIASPLDTFASVTEQYNLVPPCCLGNDLYYVAWGVKLYSLTTARLLYSKQHQCHYWLFMLWW